MDFEKIKKYLPFIIFAIVIFLPILGPKAGIFVIFAIIFYIIYKKLNPAFLRNGRNNKFMEQTIDINKIASVKKIRNLLLIFILAGFLIWLFFASVIIVDAGETGVYSLFGKVKDEELRSGFHLVIPLAKVTKMSIRTEEYTMSIAQGEGKKFSADAITSLTKEGLSVDLDMTILYRLEEEKASDVYRELGLSYDEKIIRPTIRTSIRDIIAQYNSKDIYSEKREEAANMILKSVETMLRPRGIIVEQVLLRNVALPANLANSIQEKLQAEQQAQKYEYLLQTEKKEKERKIIEAEGQRDAQKIINESLTPNYLYYLYIKELKDREGTIYVPTNPANGMPLFKDLRQ